MTPVIKNLNMDEIPDVGQMPNPGRHRAKLTDCVKDVSGAGNDMLVWPWEVIEGDDKGTAINSYSVISKDVKKLGSLKMHLTAFGFSGEVEEVDTKKLINRTAIIVVTKTKFNDKETGEEREGRSVANVLPDAASGSKKPGSVQASVVDEEDVIPF